MGKKKKRSNNPNAVECHQCKGSGTVRWKVFKAGGGPTVGDMKTSTTYEDVKCQTCQGRGEV